MAETLKQPEIMNIAQTELPEVDGKGKPIEEADVSRLPYLQFIVKETLSMHPPAPFLIPRRVDHDVELCDYIIPNGSLVLVNVWAIDRDSIFWEEPLVFKLERFQSLELNVPGKIDSIWCRAKNMPLLATCIENGSGNVGLNVEFVQLET